jgi:hypothetical protein
MPPELETRAGRYLEQVKRVFVDGDNSAYRTTEQREAEKVYGEYLTLLLRHVARNDRRMGILSLFWLAHFKSLRESLLATFDARGAERSKYRLWPVMAGFYQRVNRGLFSSLTAAEKRFLNFNLGRDYNHGLFTSLVEDQLALTEPDVRSFNPMGALGAHNSQFMVDGDIFASVLLEARRRSGGARGAGSRGHCGRRRARTGAGLRAGPRRRCPRRP